MAIRILVSDDHPIVRDGLVAVLSTQADFVVVGQAGLKSGTPVKVVGDAPPAARAAGAQADAK